MGRKSLKIERRAQILDAFEECILKHGVEGSTLQRIADEAGMQRTIIGHYFGTRRALVEDVVARILDRYRKASRRLLAAVPAERRLETAIELLFDTRTTPREDVLYQALFTAAERDPEIQRQLREATAIFVRYYSDLLALSYPAAAPDEIERVSCGLISLSYGGWTLLSIGCDAGVMTHLRVAADSLLATLGDRTDTVGAFAGR